MLNNHPDLMLVVPFYNEEKRLPFLLNSLYVSATMFSLKYHLILVDHNSTDGSGAIVNNFESKFHKVSIIHEDFPIKCGGKPRNRGFKEALKLVNSLYKNEEIPIATIDADVVVPTHFGKEIIEKLKSDCIDIVVFCERYDQGKLLNFIATYQKNREFAFQAFVGLNWFRYQMLWSLILSGIKEARGSGGYAMLPITLQGLKHFQPFDDKGKPVTGENNRLGIIANLKKLIVYASPYHSKVHPRRELESCLNIETKGYDKSENNSEIFKLAREKDTYPELNNEQLDKYLNKGILRAIRMVLIRAIAYQKIEYLKSWFDDKAWLEMLAHAQQYINVTKPSLETLNVVGSGIYGGMFDFVLAEMNTDNLSSFVEGLRKKIPSNKTLLKWAENRSEIIKPDNWLIEGLVARFNSVYSVSVDNL